MDRIFQLAEIIILGKPQQEDIYQECLSLLNSSINCSDCNVLTELFYYLKEKGTLRDFQQLKRFICAPSLRRFLTDVSFFLVY